MVANLFKDIKLTSVKKFRIVDIPVEGVIVIVGYHNAPLSRYMV
jgi:hypothetical protein